MVHSGCGEGRHRGTVQSWTLLPRRRRSCQELQGGSEVVFFGCREGIHRPSLSSWTLLLHGFWSCKGHQQSCEVLEPDCTTHRGTEQPWILLLQWRRS